MDSRTFDVASRIFAAQLTRYSRPAESMEKGTDTLIYGSIRAALKFVETYDRIAAAEKVATKAPAKVKKANAKVAP